MRHAMAVMNEDVAVLNQSMKLSKEGVHQIVYSLSQGSYEVQDILLNECNVIYECKICSNLFRSLANLLSHKRSFCKLHCCSNTRDSDCDKYSSYPNDNNDNIENYSETSITEPDSPESARTSHINVEAEKTEDLNNNEKSAVIKSPTKIRQSYVKLHVDEDLIFRSYLAEISDRAKCREMPIVVKCSKIPTNRNAVTQAIYSGSVPDAFNLQLKNMPSMEVKKSNSPIADNHKINGNIDAKFECDVCSTSFSSNWQLGRHIKEKHSTRTEHSSKPKYKCPCCTQTLYSIANVCRHLRNVHKKNDSQISRLRQIAAKSGKISAANDKFKCTKCGCNFKLRDRLASHMIHCKGSLNGLKVKSEAKANVAVNSEHSNGVVRNLPNKVKCFPKPVHKKHMKNSAVGVLNKKAKVAKISAKNGQSGFAKMQAMMDVKKLLCKVCKMTLSTRTTLTRHVSSHLGVFRYKCSICTNKAYFRGDVCHHVMKSHKDKLKNDEDVNNLIVELKT